MNTSTKFPTQTFCSLEEFLRQSIQACQVTEEEQVSITQQVVIDVFKALSDEYQGAFTGSFGSREIDKWDPEKLATSLRNQRYADSATLIGEVLRQSRTANSSLETPGEVAKTIFDRYLRDPSKKLMVSTQENYAYISTLSYQVRVELAKLCAKHDGWTTAWNIERFGINPEDSQGQKNLLEIAKLCVQQNPIETIRSIRNFKISDKNELMALAKICAKHSAWATTRNLSVFGIHANNQKALLELARLCAQESAGATAFNFREFGIRKEDDRIEIAKLCAEKNGGSTASGIGNFGIQKNNQTALATIARLCAQQDGKSTAINIRKFGITQEEELIAIAKLCALQSSEGTAESIGNFCLQNQEGLFEVARLCAQQNSTGTAQKISRFHLSECSQRKKIFGLCIVRDAQAWLSVEHFDLADPVLTCMQKTLQTSPVSSNTVSLLIKSLDCEEEERRTLLGQLKSIMLITDEEVRESKLKWFLTALAGIHTLEPGARKWLLSSSLWPQLFELRAPGLRRDLTAQLLELSSEPIQRDFWSNYLPEPPQATRSHLSGLPLSALHSQGAEPVLLTRAFTLLTQSKVWKDKILVTDMITTIHTLSTTPSLTNEQKVRGLSKVISDNERSLLDSNILKRRVKAMRILLQIKARNWLESEKDLITIIEEKLKELIPTNSFQGDLLAQYEKRFLKSRHPDGLAQYVAGIRSLNDLAASASLGRIVGSILEDRFAEMRYDRNSHPHLAQVFDSKASLEEDWRKVVTFRYRELCSGKQLQEKLNWGAWLYEKLFRDNHLGEKPLDELQTFLEAPDEKKAGVLEEHGKKVGERIRSLKDKSGKGKASVKAKTHTEDLEYQRLKLQHECMKLARTTEQAPLRTLETIKQWIPEHTEFMGDVQARIEDLNKEPSQQRQPVSVVVSDDPFDLLFSGTDVTGSCQRLDGNAHLNKGLLGTLEDGKTQILAIKDAMGRIVARRLLRLMWDGKQPVLFQERTYPDMTPPDQQQVLNEAAKRRAKALGIPLTAIAGTRPYGSTLYSLGGPAPYEYSDGAGGVQLYGRYFHDARLVD